jgi:hypothetical protein
MLVQDLFFGHPCAETAQHVPDRNSKPADAGLTASLAGFYCYSGANRCHRRAFLVGHRKSGNQAGK